MLTRSGSLLTRNINRFDNGNSIEGCDYMNVDLKEIAGKLKNHLVPPCIRIHHLSFPCKLII